ncbi:hypothetical protein LCP9604111_2305 [Penicillium roqueforti]|uniref:uncharacterized protein n=1 Tax=Penicillium roqueforti TaxID=5082 RepID=UPI00190D13A1|nr:uncharacterized protein LCP9604111_2305 [Penicillium roqueforti]KAF9252309.1 hypothetical protein LCP9604111_2305 [Penicillium roqueforti]KAI2728758.1 hypothetical protein CBS147354_2005 [Penicillium roqueforti]KAI3239368.1 hypothetical protein CBS147310_1998 [Penicillium roqueforti]KAI3266135.1 hypothetical protein DTO012A9_1676 [Penicillium roqueforti]KAI3291989.1 hypothetical protein DTO002I6_5623 [Penicillium roqueforti]
MSAKEFLVDVEGGVVPVDCHEKVLRIAFIYMEEELWLDSGVFDVVEKLHARGWSFGAGELRFNRTLDIFYLAQLAAAIYRSTNQLEGDFPSPDDFQSFYTTHHALLHSSAWRSYYSTAFLTQRTTARFYRLPDLQDLPDSDSPLGLPRQRAPAHATKLPRWAHSVVCTHRRQLSLPLATLTGLALSTLETTITRLRTVYTSVPPYSETQARFWLEYMGLGSPGRSGSAKAVSREVWGPNIFGILVAQGAYDLYAWEAKYSAQLWEASAARREVAEPDVDGVWESEVMWCGLPDGGVGSYAWCRGWEGEVGSEEEVKFLAAVAVEETMGVKAEVGELDFAVRSYMFLGVMRAAVERRERDIFLEELERGMVLAGRIEEGRAWRWLREVFGVVEPYVMVWEGVWPATEVERGEVLRQILVENGQLFARWKRSPVLKEFSFVLGPRE